MGFAEHKNSSLVYMAADRIEAVHAFTTRYGGVSGGIWASLNLGVKLGDDEAAVRENYRAVCFALGIPADRLVLSRQVHQAEVRTVTAKDSLKDVYDQVPYEADGLITAEKNLPLVISVADCIPILLWDKKRDAVGAVHAGWRGTVLDIAGKAVEAMGEEFGSDPGDIRAAIGPGISSCCFETGFDVPEAVYQVLGTPAADYITRTGGKFKVDLKGVNRALLIRAGLLPDNIQISAECTNCSSEKYWSHRKTAGRRGSQAAFIMCRGL